MKATGIVRKLDELGRVVIPKEIRKKLSIAEGSNIEIFIEDNGNLILKKYSPVFNIAEVANTFCCAIQEKFDMPCIITDNEQIIATKGVCKKDFLNKTLSDDFAIKYLSTSQSVGAVNFELIKNQKENFLHASVIPIISAGFVYGSIVVLSPKEVVSGVVLACEVVAGYISKMIE